jgi:3-oxoadipate enol-lactonase
MSLLRGLDLARPDTTIRYWTAGPDTAPTVVFLHGATLDHHAWDPQVAALRERFRIVVPDLRGHGDSAGHFDFETAVEDILVLLDHLVVDKVVLVGLSLGANIAQAVVRRAPDRVLALVVADATCNTATRHPLAATAGVTALRMQALQSPAAFARQTARATADDPEVQQYVLDVNANRSSRETVDILSSLLTTALAPDPEYRLPVPTLLVHGDHDRIGDIAASLRTWAQRDPNARYAVIPHAGHASNLDNPDAFTAVLDAFLADVLPTDVLPAGAPGPLTPRRSDPARPPRSALPRARRAGHAPLQRQEQPR